MTRDGTIVKHEPRTSNSAVNKPNTRQTEVKSQSEETRHGATTHKPAQPEMGAGEREVGVEGEVAYSVHEGQGLQVSTWRKAGEWLKACTQGRGFKVPL